MGLAMICVIVIVVCWSCSQPNADWQTNAYEEFKRYKNAAHAARAARYEARTDLEGLDDARKAVRLIRAIGRHGEISVVLSSKGKYFLDIKSILPLECLRLKFYRDARDAGLKELENEYADSVLKELFGDGYKRVIEECGYHPRVVMAALSPLTGDWDGDLSLLCLPVFCGDSASDANRADFIRALGL